MKSIFILFLSISCLSFIETQKFSEESPYIILSIMDVKVHEWKPDVLNTIEKTLDAELKYTDEKKGTACTAIDFEQERGYPKQNARFLDVSFRGICTDAKGKKHPIEKDLITKAIIRLEKEVNEATSLTFYRIGQVQLYERDRNKLNLIIIPSSISFIVFLACLTFYLRRMRNAQKRRHIIAELHKKNEVLAKKAQTIANIDPQANDKQRLLQPDPSVVGNVSNTMGSPKQFTKEPSPARNNAINTSEHRHSNREHQETPPPPIPSKENRPPYYNRDNETSLQTQRSFKSNRERTHAPYENETHFSPTHSQYPYEQQQHHPEMFSMYEQHPRVVVRSIRDDGNHQTYHQQPYVDSSKTFVSIPVQIEHSTTHQRFVPPPYHSDPYYPHTNS